MANPMARSSDKYGLGAGLRAKDDQNSIKLVALAVVASHRICNNNLGRQLHTEKLGLAVIRPNCVSKQHEELHIKQGTPL